MIKCLVFSGELNYKMHTFNYRKLNDYSVYYPSKNITYLFFEHARFINFFPTKNMFTPEGPMKNSCNILPKFFMWGL